MPFALPTAVAGIALTSLTADTGLIGKSFARFGIHIAYTRIGITVALVFIGIPFVVRTVQPVLEKLDPSYEEAAGVLGASRTKIFWSVVFPEIRPAVITGFGIRQMPWRIRQRRIYRRQSAVSNRDHTIDYHVRVARI